ncbi:MAG: sigma-70 family RNA polymerase sigma factor [Bacteroides sp.]|nr:sigma-70 family RNA polymerase sigma factor [Eubacterium sp.]MCM1418419.1 sigma-70 family RNA polymerase sigma factor [Roseburia sp.]MCM1461559.1 sigma-70 family RNA polymerase sigma factor [Bacteroides sp.]
MNRLSDQFIEENLGLVHSLANRFRGRGIEYEELYSAGCVGLVKAAKGFDETRGLRFSTYAVPVILGEIKRLFRDGGTVKVSRGLKELSLKIARYREDRLVEGRDPTLGELAERFGVSVELVTEAISAARPALSLTGSDEDGSEFDLPVEPPQAKAAERIALGQCLSLLGAEDRRLIYLRYWKGLTQSETGKRLGMTQVQVSRREKRLLERLREELV